MRLRARQLSDPRSQSNTESVPPWLAAIEQLSNAGFKVDYFAIRRALNLEVPDRDCDDLVVLVAAQLGPARLIDNIVVTI